jgi:hypothetical protein
LTRESDFEDWITEELVCPDTGKEDDELEMNESKHIQRVGKCGARTATAATAASEPSAASLFPRGRGFQHGLYRNRGLLGPDPGNEPENRLEMWGCWKTKNRPCNEFDPGYLRTARGTQNKLSPAKWDEFLNDFKREFLVPSGQRERRKNSLCGETKSDVFPGSCKSIIFVRIFDPSTLSSTISFRSNRLREQSWGRSSFMDAAYKC